MRTARRRRVRPGVAIGTQAWREISLRTLKVSGENRRPAPLVKRVMLAMLRYAVGIKMGCHGHSNALDIDLVISARGGRALRVDMAGVAVARCTANLLLRGPCADFRPRTHSVPGRSVIRPHGFKDDPSLEAAQAPVFRTGRRNGPATGSGVSCRRRPPTELHPPARPREAVTAWGGICDEAKSGRIRGRVCFVADARPARKGAKISTRRPTPPH